MRTWPKSSVTMPRTLPRLMSSQRSLTSQRPIPQAMTRAAERGAGTSSTVSKVFLDTNLLAYQFDGSEPVKQRVARSVVATPEHSFVVSTQVLLEFFTVLTRKLRPALAHAAAVDAVRALSRLPVVSADASLVHRALFTAGQHQLSVWDAMIIEAAAESGCSEVWTEDLATGRSIRGLVIVNPFAI